MPAPEVPGVRRAINAGLLRRTHVLPFPGEILVGPGDSLGTGAQWALCYPRGGASACDLARISGLPPARIREATHAPPGDHVNAGTVLAERGWLPFGRGRWVAASNGRITHLSPMTGFGYFEEESEPVPLYARLGGKVVDAAEGSHIVVEGEAVSVRCAYGEGGAGFGRILVATSGNDLEFPLLDQQEPWLVVLTESLDPAWLDSLDEDVAAVVAPSIAPDRFAALSRATPSGRPAVRLWGRLPVLLTEGICSSRMPPTLQRIFRAHAGKLGCADGGSRPGHAEVILEGGIQAKGLGPAMRIAAGPHLGEEVTPLGTETSAGRSQAGYWTHLMEVRRAEGGRFKVPLENLEVLT